MNSFPRYSTSKISWPWNPCQRSLNRHVSIRHPIGCRINVP